MNNSKKSQLLGSLVVLTIIINQALANAQAVPNPADLTHENTYINMQDVGGELKVIKPNFLLALATTFSH